MVVTFLSFISEFILLSDTLGVSTLVDSINRAKPAGATEGTVLGPFYTEDAREGKKLDSCVGHFFLIRFCSSGER
jgi:hypothetical protein